MRSRTRVIIVSGSVALACCGGTQPPPIETGTSAYFEPSAPVRATTAAEQVAVGEPAGPRVPSGFFLVDEARLGALRRDPGAAAGTSWKALLADVEEALGAVKPGSSAENVATAYLVTGNPRYAEGAFRMFELLAKKDVRWDSYLTFGDLMRGAAFVLDYCRAALSTAQRERIADYLEGWTRELWFDNKGTGWALTDPANNYHHAFLEGTAYAAYALREERRPSADALFAVLRDKIERADGVLAHLARGGRGGDWHEGANYGERSKQRMFSAFAAIASKGGPDYFARTAFVDESILYAAYQAQPGLGFLAPNGDLPRDVKMDVSPFDRDYVQLAAHFAADARTRGLGAWYLHEVAPTYLMERVKVRGELYRDVLLPSPGRPTPPSKLPLGYRSHGTDWLNARSGWDRSATSLTVVATPRFTQSHAHIDTGSFVLWHGGWQAADAGSYGRSGLHWSAGAHNMIHVPGHARRSGVSRGLVRYLDDGALFYAQVDASNQLVKRMAGAYAAQLDEWTRELVYLRPGTLVVYDRVVPKPECGEYSWRLHFANRPSLDGRVAAATNGAGSIAVTVLDGGEAKVVENTDLTDGPSRSWRLEVLPEARGRFLAAIHVGDAPPRGRAPAAVVGAGIQGVASGNEVVVFSAGPRGEPARLPFTYRVPGDGKHAHTLVDMEGGHDIEVTRESGFVTVRVARGKRHQSDEGGLVRFTD